MVTTQIIYKMASLTVNGVECGPRNFFFKKKIVSLQCVFDFCKFSLWKIVRELFSFFSPKKKKKYYGVVCVMDEWGRVGCLLHHYHTATLLAAYGSFCFFWLVKLMFWLDLLGSLALLDFELLFLLRIGKICEQLMRFLFILFYFQGLDFVLIVHVWSIPHVCAVLQLQLIFWKILSFPFNFKKIKCLNISLSIWSTTNTRE